MLKISGSQVVRIATGLPQSCCHTKLQYSYYCRAAALSAPFASYLLSLCPDHLADTSSCNTFIPWFGGEALWEQSVRQKGHSTTGIPANPGLKLRFQDSEFNGETTKPPRLTHVIDNMLLLARKYAQIYLRGHYLFRVANSFLWASTNR